MSLMGHKYFYYENLKQEGCSSLCIHLNISMCMCLSEYVPHACKFLLRPEKSMRSPGAGVTADF